MKVRVSCRCYSCRTIYVLCLVSGVLGGVESGGGVGGCSRACGRNFL